METLTLRDRECWRSWLIEHHLTCAEIWLVFHKSHISGDSISYEETVEEALCFGWIDSLIKRIDADRYAGKFTPRRRGSQWSEVNKKRAEKMMDEGLMTDAGRRLVEEAKQSGEWDRVRIRPAMPTDTLPHELEEALTANVDAARNFHALAPSYQKQYILWIATAKRAETRHKRMREAIQKLERGELLGLK